MLELCTILFSVLSKIMKFYKYSKLNFIKDAPAPEKGAKHTRYKKWRHAIWMRELLSFKQEWYTD